MLTPLWPLTVNSSSIMIEASSSPPLPMLECWLTQCYTGLYIIFIQVTLFAVTSKCDSHVKSRIEHFTTLLPISSSLVFHPLLCDVPWMLEEWHRHPFWIICTKQSSFPVLWLVKIVRSDWCPLQKASSLFEPDNSPGLWRYIFRRRFSMYI